MAAEALAKAKKVAVGVVISDEEAMGALTCIVTPPRKK